MRPIVLAAGLVALQGWAFGVPVSPGFFEPDQPFFHTQVRFHPPGDTTNFVVRGILLPLPSGHCFVFDQELLRMAGLWKVPSGGQPVTPTNVAQVSYLDTYSKAASHPEPTGPLIMQTRMHRGIARSLGELAGDPRPPGAHRDNGRGPLPAHLARFSGVELSGDTAVLHYEVGGTAVREWPESRPAPDEIRILRNFEIEPSGLLHLSLGVPVDASWTLANPRQATADSALHGRVRIEVDSEAITLSLAEGELVATVAPSQTTRRFTVELILPSDGSTRPPRPKAALRWPGAVTAPVELEALNQNGFILDKIAPPDDNPWNRRIRVADLAFLSEDRAAVLTYDGDVWLVDGLADPALAKVSWRRFASGLHESLSIVAVDGIIQASTKNGVVRLHDRDGNGEADWFENFNDHMIQSQSMRSFPLDMALHPDGSTFITQGGIRSALGITFDENRPHTGSIMRISPDGRSSQIFAMGSREPFVTVHPKTGTVTATDQQGNFIPSSVCYFVRPGDDFGFLQPEPKALAPALVWIPQDQDNSSSSQVWMDSEGMGVWQDRLLHLSYGNGRLLLIDPDLEAPVPQGAAIPLDLKTDLPLLHARMHPRGDAVFLAGFQIWGTLTRTNWGIGRLRPGNSPVVTAIGARSHPDGVVLEFATPLDPSSLQPGAVTARAWNYVRSPAYGSGRHTLAGEPGTTSLGVAQVVPSVDRKSVFVHLPGLPHVMQLEVRHDVRLSDGTVARGATYFTIHRHNPFDLAKAGFPPIDLTKAAPPAAEPVEPPPSVARGRSLAESLGCLACHSTDGSAEGKPGPTWKGLFGSQRTAYHGATEVADGAYLRARILDPQEKRSSTAPVEMPPYRGVLSESQIEALIRYIRQLQ